MLKKIFPAGVGNTPYNSFKLVLVAEGYVAGEEAKFAGHCVELIERLLNTTPFNLTRARPNWLSVYAAFKVSANSGPADNAAADGRTAFDSALNSGLGVLTVNQAKVNTYVAAETIPRGSTSVPLSTFCRTGDRAYGKSAALVVLIVPSVVGHPQGGDMETAPGANDYYFVATTVDGLYEQVIARSIARCLGLGDEFDLPGAGNLAPADVGAGGLHFNVQYFPAGPPDVINDRMGWYRLVSLSQRGRPSNPHAKADPTTTDRTLSAVPAAPATIEFWEGGAGYRTQMWRSAQDCLMRRRIGDLELPVRTARVPLCLACRHFLANVFR